MLQASPHAIHFKRILNFGEGQPERFKFGTCSAAYPSYCCTPVLHESRARDELVLRVLSTQHTDEEIFDLGHEGVNPREVEQEPEEEPVPLPFP